VKVVLLLAGGAGWETQALAALNGRRDLVVLKRCVDVDDLLATAASGQADTAVIALEAPGFDLLAVDHLQVHGVRAIAVVSSPGEEGAVRAARIGVRATVADTDLEALPGAVLTEHAAPASPGPATPSEEPVVEEPDPALRGRVIVVFGPTGAPGRTTVATSLAGALTRDARTTLIDVDPYGGTVAQVLGVLDEVSGLLAAARLAGSGLLHERFNSVQRALDPRFTVVTGLPRADRWTEVRPGTVELLVDIARSHGHVVVDTGFCLDDDDASGRPGRHHLTVAALGCADEIVVVGTADPVGLGRLTRALVEVRDRQPATPLHVVVNRMRPTIGWTERHVGQLLAGFVRPEGLHFLPEDRPAVDRALVAGRGLFEIDAESPLAAAITAVADGVLDVRTAARRPTPRRRRRAAPRLRA